MLNSTIKPYVCYVVFSGSPHVAGKSSWAKWRAVGVYENLDCCAADAVELKRQDGAGVVAVLAYDQHAGWRSVRCFAPTDSKIGHEHVKHAYSYLPERDYWQLMETMARMALRCTGLDKNISVPIGDPITSPTAQTHADAPPAKPGEETFDLGGA